jgi:hypothetical protein
MRSSYYSVDANPAIGYKLLVKYWEIKIRMVIFHSTNIHRKNAQAINSYHKDRS